MWRRLFLVLSIGFTGGAWGATLPTGLRPADIAQLVSVVGFGTASHLLRSAEPYATWPGAKVGMEIPAFGRKEINLLGDANGSVPDVLLAPRLFISKGLFSDLEFTLTFLPASVSNFSSFGGLLKWGFYKESSSWLASAAYFSYAEVTGFSKGYSGSNVEFGVAFSKDYVRMCPYFGGGFLFARGTVLPEYAATPVLSALQTTLHLFMGVEFELPLNITIQADLVNLTPTGTLFIGYHF